MPASFACPVILVTLRLWESGHRSTAVSVGHQDTDAYISLAPAMERKYSDDLRDQVSRVLQALISMKDVGLRAAVADSALLGRRAASRHACRDDVLQKATFSSWLPGSARLVTLMLCNAAGRNPAGIPGRPEGACACTTARMVLIAYQQKHVMQSIPSS